MVAKGVRPPWRTLPYRLADLSSPPRLLLAGLLLAAPAGAAEPFAHADWTALLAAHVDEAGWVDYAGFAGDRAALDGYIGRLAGTSPDSHRDAFPTPQHALAYWINAYNALTVRGVLDRGIDTPSVWGDGLLGTGFFRVDRGVLGGRTLSLQELEDDIVRARFADPRIHAALNCASVSCPRLPREAFAGETLEAVLDAAMREFAAAERNCAVDTARGTVTLSQIFDWFADDFRAFERGAGNPDPSVLDYINRYRDPAAQLPPTLRIDYRPYDKRLNRQPGPR